MTNLNELNQINVRSPGKIAVVWDTATDSHKFIYTVDEFDPVTQILEITQIWTPIQAELVRKEIDTRKKDLLADPEPTPEDVAELIYYFNMLEDWLYNADITQTMGD